MLKNYFTVAWRNLLRNKTLSAIKICSLSIGLIACMLVFLYIKDETSYDRFHENSSLLYRTALEWWMFVLPMVIILATALITMSIRSVKAAMLNPVKSLRAE